MSRSEESTLQEFLSFAILCKLKLVIITLFITLTG